MRHEQSRLLLLRLCDVSLALSWLPTLIGPMAKPATVVATVVLCRPGLASGAVLGASAGVTFGTSLCPARGASSRLTLLATLAAARRGGRLPLLLVTKAGIPLLPS